MKICDNIKDLTCENCIHSAPRQQDYNLDCKYPVHRPVARIVAKDSFCGEKGEWVLKAKLANCHWEEGKKIDDGAEEKVKVLTRDYAVATLLNDGYLDW